MRATVSKFEEWRSNFKDKWLRLFVVVIVVETMYYACGFTFMRATASEFEEWISDFKEICLRLFQTICGRHRNMDRLGNNIIAIRTKFHSMRATIGKFEKWRSKFKEKCLRLFVVIYKHLLLWFWCWLLNTLCIQTFVHIALTNCELHWHM